MSIIISFCMGISKSTCNGEKRERIKEVFIRANLFIIFCMYTLAVTFFVNTSVSTTSVPEDQDAMICIQRNGTTNRNYTVTIQPNLIPGGAQCKEVSL